MASEGSAAALRELQTLFRAGAACGLTDRQLLERFAACRDEAAEAAFAALVNRHGPMVWGVCRRVLREPADASDAFQATFLILVRKAGSVRVGDSLGPWLYGVSVRVARRARVVAVRRRGREQGWAELPVAAGEAADGQGDVRSVIDEELSRLPSRYRAALILCYLEGVSHEEAARRLNCPVGTVRSRLARGRDLLRPRLARRGLAPGAVVVPAAAFAPEAVQGASLPSLFATTARTAARLAAGRTLAGTVPAGVRVLAAGVLRSMILSRTAVIATFLAVPLLAAGALAAGRDAGTKPRMAPPEAPAAVVAASIPRVPVAVALLADDKGAKAAKDENPFADLPPFVVKTTPPTGSTDVDPSLTELRATFSKAMQDGSWSWAGSGETFPKSPGKPRYDEDKRTCVLPVKLEPGKTYVISLNSQRFRNFKDTSGQPAMPYLLVFRTRK